MYGFCRPKRAVPGPGASFLALWAILSPFRGLRGYVYRPIRLGPLSGCFRVACKRVSYLYYEGLKALLSAAGAALIRAASGGSLIAALRGLLLDSSSKRRDT